MARAAKSTKSNKKSGGPKRGNAKTKTSTSRRRSSSPTSAGSRGGAGAGKRGGADKRGGAKGSRGRLGSDGVGSDRTAATRQTGGRGDFGVPAAKRDAARGASRRIKAQHQGERSESGDVQPRAGTDTREAGVGGREAGPGSFSGGDVDTDVTGVGAGGRGIAQAGPDDERDIGQAASTGGSEEFASGPPSAGRNRRGSGGGRAGGSPRSRGSTVTPVSEDTTSGEQTDTSVGFTTPDRSSASGRESTGLGR